MRGTRRSGHSKPHGVVVVGKRHIEQHDAPARTSGVLFKLLEVVNDQDFALHATGRRGDAAAESEHRDGVTGRLENVGALASPHPHRNHDRLGVDVLETVPLHLVHRPRDGAIERRRAAQARADGVGQQSQALPPEGIAHRFPDETRGRFPIPVEPRVRHRRLDAASCLLGARVHTEQHQEHESGGISTTTIQQVDPPGAASVKGRRNLGFATTCQPSNRPGKSNRSRASRSRTPACVGSSFDRLRTSGRLVAASGEPALKTSRPPGPDRHAASRNGCR